MQRTKSLMVRGIAFGAASLVFVALLAFRGEGTRASNDAIGLGPAFPAIKLESIQSVEIEQTSKVDGKPEKHAIRLVRSGPGAWKLASSFDHPAVTATVENWLKGLSRVKLHSEPTSNPSKFSAFAGTDGFLDVRIFEGEGAPVLSYGVGKTDSGGGYGSKRFVRLDDPSKPGAGRILVVSELDGADSLTSPTYWVETRLLPSLSAADVVEMTIEQGAAHRPMTLARGKKAEANAGDAGSAGGPDKPDLKDKDDLWTVAAPIAQPALSEPVMGVVRGFVGLSLASIEAGPSTGADDAKFGFDKPELVITGTGKPGSDKELPPTWTLRIGKKVEGKSAWYARRSTSKKDDPFVFSVNDYELTDFRKDPDQFAEKKPEPPAPATPETAGMGDTPAMGDVPPPEPVPTPPPGSATPGSTPPPSTPPPSTPPPSTPPDEAGMDAAPPAPTPPATTPAPSTPPGSTPGSTPADGAGMDAPPPK